MTNVTKVATIMAYEAKDGTFSIAMKTDATGEIVRKQGYADLNSATYAVKMLAWDSIGEVNYATMHRKGEYLANVWLQS